VTGSGALAVLVDLDGTLVTTEAAWRLAYQRFADELDVELPTDLWSRIAGHSMRASLQVLGPAAERDSAAAISRLTELAIAAELGPDAWLPGAAALLTALAQADLPHAIVTSSERPFALHALASHPIPSSPGSTGGTPPAAPTPLLVCGSETARAKPHPDPYLRAARLLRVHPRDCLVIEDSPSGVAAAETAGMAVLAVPRTPTARAALPPRPGRARRDDLIGLDVSGLRDLHARLRSALDAAQHQ